MVRIGEFGAHQHVARVLADARVDRVDFSLESLAGERVESERRFLADLKAAQRLLGRLEIGVDRIQAFRIESGCPPNQAVHLIAFS